MRVLTVMMLLAAFGNAATLAVDAVLEIEFLPSLVGAFVSAIEVERL